VYSTYWQLSTGWSKAPMLSHLALSHLLKLHFVFEFKAYFLIKQGSM
jgi:hypothetical protein